MHHRSSSWVKGHYRNGTWIAGHNRKSTYVSDYTKNYYTRSVFKKPTKINRFKHQSSVTSPIDESIKKFNIERDKNIYIVTVLEREKNRIKPPIYEKYFKGTFEEELAYNRNHRLRSITSESVSIAEEYLGRVIGVGKAKLLKKQAMEEYYLDNDKTETLQRTEHIPESEKETIVNTIFKKAKTFIFGKKAVRADKLTSSRARVEANRAKTKAESEARLEAEAIARADRLAKAARIDKLKNRTLAEDHESSRANDAVSFYLYRINRITKSDIIAYGVKYITINDFKNGILNVEKIDEVKAPKEKILLLERKIYERYGALYLDAPITDIKGTYLSSLDGIKLLIEETLYTSSQRLERKSLREQIAEERRLQEEKEFPFYLYKLTKPGHDSILGYGITFVDKNNFKGTWMKVEKIYEVKGLKKDILRFEEKINDNYERVATGILELGIKGTSFSNMNSIKQLAEDDFVV